MKETFIVEESDLAGVAQKVISTIRMGEGKGAKVLFLHGDLGAGKTTFTKEIAHALGINKDDVHSPTFILKKSYATTDDRFKKLIHIDAYRFESKDEARILDLDRDKEEDGALIVIEWPSRMYYNAPDMEVFFTVTDDTKRAIEIAV